MWENYNGEHFIGCYHNNHGDTVEIWEVYNDETGVYETEEYVIKDVFPEELEVC